MQYWRDSWRILGYSALAHETTPNTHVGCSDTTGVIWGLRLRAPIRTSRNHDESDRKGKGLGLVYMEMDARLGGVAACLYNPPF